MLFIHVFMLGCWSQCQSLKLARGGLCANDTRMKTLSCPLGSISAFCRWSCLMFFSGSIACLGSHNEFANCHECVEGSENSCDGNGEAKASKVLTVNAPFRNVWCKRHAALQAWLSMASHQAITSFTSAPIIKTSASMRNITAYEDTIENLHCRGVRSRNSTGGHNQLCETVT